MTTDFFVLCAWNRPQTCGMLLLLPDVADAAASRCSAVDKNNAYMARSQSARNLLLPHDLFMLLLRFRNPACLAPRLPFSAQYADSSHCYSDHNSVEVLIEIVCCPHVSPCLLHLEMSISCRLTVLNNISGVAPSMWPSRYVIRDTITPPCCAYATVFSAAYLGGRRWCVAVTTLFDSGLPLHMLWLDRLHSLLCRSAFRPR